MVYMGTNETMRTPGQDEIERVRSETYDELCEEFLDLIFEYDAVLVRNEWEKEVLAKQTYLFDPLSIRKKLGYRIWKDLLNYNSKILTTIKKHLSLHIHAN